VPRKQILQLLRLTAAILALIVTALRITTAQTAPPVQGTIALEGTMKKSHISSGQLPSNALSPTGSSVDQPYRRRAQLQLLR